MKTVFWLGAGFSAPYRLPVMGNFFDHALEGDAIDSDEKALLRELRANAEARHGFIKGDHDNIEHVLSLAMAGSIEALASESLADRLKTILFKVYARFGLHVDDWEAPTQLEQFIRRNELPRGWEFAVVTTNYDVVAEYAFRQIGLPLALPFEHVPRCGNEHGLYSDRNDGPKIYKLHGSLNWRLVDGRVEVYDRMEVRSHWGEDDHSRNAAAPEVCNREKCDAFSPLIVPPTFFKETPHSLFEVLRRQAWQELASADKVIIVGYSFPQTDAHMRYFVASALASNKSCRQLHIVDLSPSDVVRNLQESTAPIGDVLQRRIVQHPGGWTGCSLDI